MPASSDQYQFQCNPTAIRNAHCRLNSRILIPCSTWYSLAAALFAIFYWITATAMHGILPQSCNTVYLLLWDQLFAWLDYIIRHWTLTSVSTTFFLQFESKKINYGVEWKAVPSPMLSKYVCWSSACGHY